jgi:ubiquitin-protein ligase
MNPNWNPYDHLDGRNPSKECLKRIRTDLKSITDDPLPGIYCVHDDTHATVIHALVVGPFDTPYEGGFFHFILNFPDDYPHNPPRVIYYIYTLSNT